MSDDELAMETASRLEAAEAGIRAEETEAADGMHAGRHVTATDVAGIHPHKHHPLDDNVGVVRVPLERGTILAGAISAIVMIAALVALGLAIGNR